MSWAFAFEFNAQSTIAVTPEHILSEQSNTLIKDKCSKLARCLGSSRQHNLQKIFKEIQAPLEPGLKHDIGSEAKHPGSSADNS